MHCFYEKASEILRPWNMPRGRRISWQGADHSALSGRSTLIWAIDVKTFFFKLFYFKIWKTRFNVFKIFFQRFYWDINLLMVEDEHSDWWAKQQREKVVTANVHEQAGNLSALIMTWRTTVVGAARTCDWNELAGLWQWRWISWVMLACCDRQTDRQVT